MSVAGAVFAALVLATVVGGVRAEVSWRGRHPASDPGQVPEPSAAAGAGSRRALWTVARVVVAAGISVAASLVSLRGALDGSLPQTRSTFIASMALVILATVVGTLGSSADPARASSVGLLLGAPPSWVLVWVALYREGDSLWLIAGLFFMLLTAGVSAAAWAATVAARWGRRQLVRSLGPFGDRQQRGR